jgi:hypothetical protein
MRFVDANGRAEALLGDEVFDLQTRSGGTLSSDPMTVIATRRAEARLQPARAKPGTASPLDPTCRIQRLPVQHPTDHNECRSHFPTRVGPVVARCTTS